MPSLDEKYINKQTIIIGQNCDDMQKTTLKSNRI